MLLLKHTSPTGKERHYDSFLAGLLGGYTVFGRSIHNSVSQQIVIYVFARVVLAIAKLAVQPRSVGDVKGGGGGWALLDERSGLRRELVKNGWVGFASLSWAMVMYVWRWHPEAVQPSLRSSMNYMWVHPYRDSATNTNLLVVMHNRTIGIRCGTSYGITNEAGSGYTVKKCDARKRSNDLVHVYAWMVV